MTTHDLAALAADLIRDEGTGPVSNGRLLPYFDCCGRFFRDCRCATQGKLTIGHGRNIEDKGVSATEARYLLDADMAEAIDDLNRGTNWWDRLDTVRRQVLVNMCFNLGWPRLRGFVRTLSAIRRGDYAAAAAGMRDSLWAKQVGARAERLARMMETGKR